MHEQRIADNAVLIASLGTFMRTYGLVEKTLSEHVCQHEDRCSCSTPNVSRPWPCTSRKAAEYAVRPVAVGRRVG